MSAAAISTELTQNLTINSPIILAPMAGVSTAKLAAAVANAGGLGLLGVGYTTERDWLTRQMKEAKRLYDSTKGGAIGAGFITWWLEKNPDLLDEILEFRPSAVWFSFGDYGQFLDKVRAKCPDAKIIVQIQTVEEAVEAVEVYGVDIVVAQGCEAGGHGRTINASTFCLLPEVNDAVGDRVPVVAAGGVTDGRSLAAALMLGGSGVVIGTRFCATIESAMHPAAKNFLVSARDGGVQTLRTNVFDKLRGYNWPDIYSFRVLRNAVTDAVQNGDDIAKWQETYDEAMKEGNFNIAHVGAGQAIGLVKGVWPAKLVVERVVEEALECLEIGGIVARRLKAKL